MTTLWEYLYKTSYHAPGQYLPTPDEAVIERELENSQLSQDIQQYYT